MLGPSLPTAWLPALEHGVCTPNSWQGKFEAGEPEGGDEEPVDREDSEEHTARRVRWGAPARAPIPSLSALLGSLNPIDTVESTMAEMLSIVFY